MSGVCEGRAAIVTGAGRGLGRAEAIELAKEGAMVLVNDLGVELDGRAPNFSPANDVVDEIRGLGGHAIVNCDDVSDWAGAKRLIYEAISAFGRLDVLVNNAGVLRDRMLVNISEDDWDTVIRVHLRGTFCPTHHAAAYWREQVKMGLSVDARVVNTTSTAGLFGNIGQANYATAKAGIAGFTIEAAAELGRYGVTVNAIAPGGRTRMTEQVFAGVMAAPDSGFDVMAPENVSPLVAWLASREAGNVTGRVFEIYGGTIGVINGWGRGPVHRQDRRFEPSQVGEIGGRLLADAPSPESL